MYVKIGARQVKLIVADDGSAFIADGKKQDPISAQEASHLLVQRFDEVCQKLSGELSNQDTFRRESALREATSRAGDVNYLLRMLNTSQDLATEIENNSDVVIESAEPVVSKQQGPAVVAMRKKVIRHKLSPVRVPELNVIARGRSA